VRDDLEIPPPGYRVARRSAGLDPATRRLATIAAGIGGAMVVLVGIWSMVGGGSSGVPVVPAPAGAMRVKPANPGGMQVMGANEPILGGNTSDKPALAPPPETPDLQALQSPPAAKPAGTTEDGESIPPAGATGTTNTATAAPAPATAMANGLPLPPPSPPPIRLAAASAAPPLPAGIGTGTATEVQFAALSSKEGALSAWTTLQAALPGLLDNRQPLVSKVEVDGHIFWRLRTGGFANIAEATSFCASVRAKGKACDIASF
jgi:SPOR domain